MHITEATLNHLDKAYEVEDGHGQQRDSYLKEMNIRTYLVIDPRVRGLRRRGAALRGATGAHTRGEARGGRAGSPSGQWRGGSELPVAGSRVFWFPGNSCPSVLLSTERECPRRPHGGTSLPRVKHSLWPHAA